jgi:hypothetical protein
MAANLLPVKVTSLIPAGTVTTTTTGAVFDMQGSLNPGLNAVKVFVAATSFAGTGPLSVTAQLMQCDTTNGTFTTAGPVSTPITTSTGGYQEVLAVVNKRYVELVLTYGTNTTSGVVYAGMLTQQIIT